MIPRGSQVPAARARAGARDEDLAAECRAGAPRPRGGVPTRRWREIACAAALFASIAMVFPVSVLLFIAFGRAAAVSAIAFALVLMLIGWVIDRG